ncbi:hypothetical protein GCM10010252_49240 [Streptomyces aureoverticillatus]|nr:hypothetical protein GCM10010252_49240 [Streptomyces aureoverticillatus]
MPGTGLPVPRTATRRRWGPSRGSGAAGMFRQVVRAGGWEKARPAFEDEAVQADIGGPGAEPPAGAPPEPGGTYDPARTPSRNGSIASRQPSGRS